jgi:hypothetical protein
MRTTIPLLLSILGACSASILVAQDTKLAGHWEGALVITAAEQEMDVQVDFSGPGSQTKGQLWFPITADGTHELESFDVQGSHVSFSVRDKDGVVSTFDGALSSDGASLQGTMWESSKAIPFFLHRGQAAKPLPEASIDKLAGDGTQLKTAFNNDIGKTRLLLLLNLGSFSSRVALRIVERFVMEQINDPDLRVYIVWMAPDVPEVANALQQEAALAPDPRITRFWSTNRSLSQIFDPMLAPYKPVANPCLLFGPEKSWMSSAPIPDRVRMSARGGAKSPVTPDQKLNGIDLAMDVQFLLPAKKAG